MIHATLTMFLADASTDGEVLHRCALTFHPYRRIVSYLRSTADVCRQLRPDVRSSTTDAAAMILALIFSVAVSTTVTHCYTVRLMDTFRSYSQSSTQPHVSSPELDDVTAFRTC